MFRERFFGQTCCNDAIIVIIAPLLGQDLMHRTSIVYQHGDKKNKKTDHRG
jgi:hypothetical protein